MTKSYIQSALTSRGSKGKTWDPVTNFSRGWFYCFLLLTMERQTKPTHATLPEVVGTPLISPISIMAAIIVKNFSFSNQVILYTVGKQI